MDGWVGQGGVERGRGEGDFLQGIEKNPGVPGGRFQRPIETIQASRLIPSWIGIRAEVLDSVTNKVMFICLS